MSINTICSVVFGVSISLPLFLLVEARRKAPSAQRAATAAALLRPILTIRFPPSTSFVIMGVDGFVVIPPPDRMGSNHVGQGFSFIATRLP